MESGVEIVHPCPKRRAGAPCRGFRPGSEYTLDQCRPCWSFHHEPHYRRGIAPRPPLPVGTRVTGPSPRCAHSGDELTVIEKQQLGLKLSRTYRSCDKGYGPQCSCDRTCGLGLCAGYDPPPPEGGDDGIAVAPSPPPIPAPRPEPTIPTSAGPMTVEFRTVDVVEPKKVEPVSSTGMKWQYAITTVPSRRNDLFLRTLDSLRRAGFDRPHLFVDGDADGLSWVRQFREEKRYGIESVTVRERNVRTAGHWTLTLYELWCRDPHADRYAIFQDDFVTYPHLRAYLETCPYPEDGYWNLYTFARNTPPFLRKKGLPAPPGDYEGWYKSDQLGKGAVALILDHTAVRELLRSEYLVDRFMDQGRGHKAIDGGIVEAFKVVGRSEYVHAPSLVQHTGHRSSMGNATHQTSPTFRGEGFDARELIKR